jgi:hypothetical protein
MIADILAILALVLIGIGLFLMPMTLPIKLIMFGSLVLVASGIINMM